MKYVFTLISCYFFVYVNPIFSQDKFNINVDIGYSSPDEKFFTIYKGVLAANIGIEYKLTGNLYGGIFFNSIYTK